MYKPNLDNHSNAVEFHVQWVAKNYLSSADLNHNRFRRGSVYRRNEAQYPCIPKARQNKTRTEFLFKRESWKWLSPVGFE